jgi:integrase
VGTNEIIASYVATKSQVTPLCQVFGDRQLSEMTPLIVDGYISQRQRSSNPRPSTATWWCYVTCLKAMAWGKVLDNPLAHIKPLRVNNRRLQYLSQEEMDRLRARSDEVLSPLLITALHTGFRRGELFHLTWQDVDFKLGVIRVLQTKNGERREIPMTNTLRATLQQLPRRLSSDYVFPGKTGHGLVDIRKCFHRALQDAGIKGFVFHDLRHTFASHLVMAGVDLMTVKEFLGHKDIKMTLRYAHLAPDYKRAAITQLDTYMDTRRIIETGDQAVNP